MRIESEFKDYYDSLQRLTPGDPDVWHRVQSVIVKDYSILTRDKKFVSLWNIRKKKIEISNHNMFVIYFCGKAYHGIAYYIALDGFKYLDHAFGKQTILDLLGEKDFHSVFPEKSKSSWRPTWEQYEETFPQKDIDTIHLKYNCPVIYEDDRKIIINPVLRIWNFQSVIDPYTAFQEIDMFRNSFLKTPERPMVQISNEDKIVKKGFDLKTSFRKPKQVK